MFVARILSPAKSQAEIAAVVPLMLFIMATILMIQLQSFHRLFQVFTVAPLALIGVVSAMLPSGAPLGSVAILGVLALIGILIRSSVILIVQIEHLKEAGRHGKRSSRQRNIASGRSCRRPLPQASRLFQSRERSFGGRWLMQ